MNLQGFVLEISVVLHAKVDHGECENQATNKESPS